jgi:hypothetical protein
MDTDTPKPESSDPLQKYIRTFAGDMEVAKAGGKPDLAPLLPHKESLAATPVVVPPATVDPAPHVWDEQAREAALAQVRAKMAEDEAHAVHRSTEKPEPLVERAEDIIAETPSPIHTYSEDFSDRMKDQHASTVTVLAAEQDVGREPVVEQGESATHRALVVAAGVLLIVLSGAGVYYAYRGYAAAHMPVVVTPPISAPIFINEEEKTTGEGGVLLRAIEASLARPLASGSVRLVGSTNATTTREGLFTALPFSAPNILLRNVEGPQSMVGVINVEGAQSAFFILGVSSYNDTFAGMLQWEPDMTKDLATLFPPYPEPVVAVPTTPLATTTPETKATPKKGAKVVPAQVVATTTPPAAPVIIPGFHDQVTANHDVRIYLDSYGRSVMLYGYWNQSTLIIARDGAAFAEIVTRLSNAHTQQ